MTLRDLLRNCRVALKKFLNKRDKWVKDWAGQVSWSLTNGGGEDSGANRAACGKDRLQRLPNRGSLLLLLGLALIPQVLDWLLLTQGACTILQARLGPIVLEEAGTRELKVRPANQLVYLPQVVIAASQIQWTADVTKCLMTAKERSDKKILKVMKKKQVGS